MSLFGCGSGRPNATRDEKCDVASDENAAFKGNAGVPASKVRVSR